MEVPRIPWACLYKENVYERSPDALGVISEVTAISRPLSHFDVHDTLPFIAVGGSYCSRW